MGHQSYVLLCTETTLSNPQVVIPKSSCDVHLLRSPCFSPLFFPLSKHIFKTKSKQKLPFSNPPSTYKCLRNIWMVPWNSSRISWLLPQISEFPTLIEGNFIVKPQDLLWLFISRFVCFSLIKGCIKFSYELRTLSKVQL